MDELTFLSNFTAIAEAPGGIHRLHELILSLAVKGQLVEQDLAEGTALELLSQVAPDQKWMTEVDNRLIHRASSDQTAHPSPFSVPDSWLWTTLGSVASYIQRGKSPTYATTGSVRVISQKCVQWSGFDGEAARFIADESVGAYGSERFLRNGDLLWNSTGTGTVGRITIFPGLPNGQRAVADSHVTVLRIQACNPRYVLSWLASHHVQSTIEQLTSGTTNQQELNTSTVRVQPLPVPPRAEQDRIVAKIEELRQRCNELATSQQVQKRAAIHLGNSRLATLATAETGEDFRLAWTRVGTHWELATSHADGIDAIRRTILQLAVRGKLTLQDPAEVSAERLVEMTLEERGRISSSRKLREPDRVTSTAEAKKPFDLPPGWTWARFTELGELARGRSKHRPRNDPALYRAGTMPMVQTGDVARADGVVESWTALYNERGVEQSRVWPAGTLCITIAANIADSALLKFDACFPDSVVGFIPFHPIEDARYFDVYMRTVQTDLQAFAPSTAQKNINLAVLDELLIPLPPLDEMRRLVESVVHLLTLCDDLERRLSTRHNAAVQLAMASVDLV